MEEIPTNVHDEWPAQPVLAYLHWRGIYHLTQQSCIVFGITSGLLGIFPFTGKPNKAGVHIALSLNWHEISITGTVTFLICDGSNAIDLWEFDLECLGRPYIEKKKKTDFCDLTLTAKIQSLQAVFKLEGYVCLHKKQNEANIDIYILCKILTPTTKKECFSSYIGNHTEGINNQVL